MGGGEEVQRADYNRLFSVSTVENFIRNGDREQNFINHLALQLPEQTTDNGTTITAVYNKLAKEYRNEYFYKNTLLNKIVLGRHSMNTTVALREVPVGQSILDFLVINGVGHVYEVKTGLDNLDRLENQLLDYYRAFKQVSVVADKEHIDTLIEMLDGTPTGIIMLRHNGALSTVKEPLTDGSCLDKEVMFKMLRKLEYEDIVKRHFEELPDVKPVEMFNACLSRFCTLDVETAHSELLRALKSRQQQAKKKSLFVQVPVALRELIYFMDLSVTQYSRLFNFLSRSV